MRTSTSTSITAIAIATATATDLVDPMDRMLAPFGAAIAAAAGLRPGDVVLDIGCGHGATTIEAARRVGPTGRVSGVDRDGAALAVARRRADAAGVAVTFVHADAATHRVEPDRAVDVAV